MVNRTWEAGWRGKRRSGLGTLAKTAAEADAADEVRAAVRLGAVIGGADAVFWRCVFILGETRRGEDSREGERWD